jgi:hypothetical protein
MAPARRAEGAEVRGAQGDARDQNPGEKDVFPDRVGHERLAVFVNQIVVVLQIRRATDKASRHRPFIDAELQHHQEVQAYKTDENPGNHKDVQREKP